MDRVDLCRKQTESKNMPASESPKPIRKRLGAYYTPKPYCTLAQHLLLEAIERVPAGNDYVVIDRCAGTGNLERGLPDDVLSHCIMSTYERDEYEILRDKFGDKARVIVDADYAAESNDGFFENLNAMSRQFVENAEISRYIDDDSCTVILYENPPYRDSAEDNWFDGKGTSESFVLKELRDALPTMPNANDSTARDLVNQFIFSGWKHYLRNDTDSYIIIAPMKYWKTLGLCDKKFEDGYLLNRKHFNATISAVGCIRWSNINDDVESITLPTYDIDKNGSLQFVRDTVIKKCHATLTSLFDKSPRDGDIETSVFCEANGYPTSSAKRKCDGKSYWNDDIIGYMRPTSFALGNKHINLVRTTIYNSRGFYIRKNNFLEMLPLFAAKRYNQAKWYDYDVFYTTSDGGEAFKKDNDFLRACLIFTCLTPHNKCLTFYGEDGREYANELCLDDEAIARDTLDKMEGEMSEREKKLVEMFDEMMAYVRDMDAYAPDIKYGTYQIDCELNTFTKKGNKRVYDHPKLNEMIGCIRDESYAYYMDVIVPKLFKYELLK